MTGCPAKVSLIVPVYNVEKYLGKCLESCRNQTLNDLEIICVDDGSTDSSGRILDEFAAEDSRVIVIHKENGGVSSARNAGLKAANGELIMFLDADDFLEKNACERVWVETREEETEIIVFSADYFPKHPEPAHREWLQSVLHTWQQRFYGFEPYILFNMPGARPFIWHQAFSAKLIKEHGLAFSEELKIGEDNLFQCMVFPHAKRFSFLPDVLYHYRVGRADSAMEQVKGPVENRLIWHVRVVDLAADYWRQQGFMAEYGTEFLDWVMHYVVSELRRDGTEIAAELRRVLEKHDFTSYSRELPREGRALWNKLQRL